MNLQTKLLLAATGLAIALAGIFFGGPGHVFWPSVVGGLLISPLWEMLDPGVRSSVEPRSLFDESDHAFSSDASSYTGGFESSSNWRSADPLHISNGGPNLTEWSDI
ncbi:hypothetical protein HA051_15195 [Chromobacterium vaccinii]|nr:hypothetical protein [Chromobacterium vaccinii]